MQKLLITTKFSLLSTSDTPGTNLPLFLIANYFRNIFNYKVIFHDPFFNSKNLLKPFCDDIIDDLNIDYNNYQRIVSPLFYIGEVLDRSNNKIYKVSGIKFFEKKFNIEKKNIQFISETRYVTDKFNPDIYSKTFDVPNLYYYEWLARENFKPNIELRKLKKIPIKKNQITVSIHFRRNNYKSSHYFLKHHYERYKHILKGEEYDQYIKSIIFRIKKKYPNSNIIIFGFDKKNDDKNLLDFFDQKNCIHIEDYSNNPLEKSIMLAKYTDIIIGPGSGFTTFTKCLGLLNGKMKKMLMINSELKLEHITYSRRVLFDAISENNFTSNSYFFNKIEILKNNSVNNLNLDYNENFKIKKINKIKYFIYYSLEYISKYYFSSKIDRIIFQELLSQNKRLYKKHKILVIKNTNIKELIKKIDFSLHQHVLTHYNLIKDYNNEKLSNGSLDFNKPLFLQKLIKEKKLNTSNLFYEDLLNFTLRECKKNGEIKLKSKINNILFIDQLNAHANKSPFNKKMSVKNLIKKTLNKSGFFSFKESKINIDWNKIISKYRNETGINCEVLNYINDTNLIYQKKNKEKKIPFNIKNINEIINKHYVIICTPNIFSILVKFLYQNRNVILFENNKTSEKIIKDNLFSNRNYSYLDFFTNKFSSFRELNYYLFNQHIDF